MIACEGKKRAGFMADDKSKRGRCGGRLALGLDASSPMAIGRGLERVELSDCELASLQGCSAGYPTLAKPLLGVTFNPTLVGVRLVYGCNY